MSNRRIAPRLSDSGLAKTNWFSAIRVPRRNCPVELSYAARRIEGLRKQLPVLGFASLCYCAYLVSKNWPFDNAAAAIGLAVSALISLRMMWFGPTILGWLRANPVRAVKASCAGACLVGMLWGSVGGVLAYPPSIAAILTGAVVAMMILSALPLAQTLFLAGFVLGELVLGGASLPVGTVSFGAASICLGTWLSAHFGFRRLKTQLALQKERFDRFAAQSGSVVWETDPRGMLSEASIAAFTDLGVIADKPAQFSIFGFASRLEGEVGAELQKENALNVEVLRHCLDSQKGFADISVNTGGKSGIHRLCLSGSPKYDSSGSFSGFAGAALDFTANARKQKQLAAAAERDALTRLMNRACFNEHLEKALTSKSATALLLIDLDKFKQANDTLGHQVGDQVLRQFSERLRTFISSDGCTARLGGDEFGVFLHEISAKAKIEDLVKALIPFLSAPYEIGGLTVTIGATIGIAIAPEHGNTVDALMRNADLALYSAKARGGNQHKFFDASLLDHALERRHLEIDLRKAIEKGELSVLYQPIVDCSTERLSGFEALCCWDHPDRGLVAADEFIPLAETSGFIDQLGEWVLREACAAAATWPNHIRLAVNLSPTQFRSPNLSTVVIGSLAQSQLAPDRLELEITEGVFLEETDATEAILRQLNEFGVRWTMDDFGTGYSSLKYLLKAPFQKIKIDREFVSGVSIPDSQKRPIVGMIVALAENLGMQTTAEGVEAKKDLETIMELGCTQVQGFVYGPKLTEAEAGSLAKSRMPIPAEGFDVTRREPRLVVLRSADIVYEGETCSATVRNVSSSGAMVESEWEAIVGRRIEIRMDHERPKAGVIRWVDGIRFGVQFDEIGSTDSRQARSQAA